MILNSQNKLFWKENLVEELKNHSNQESQSHVIKISKRIIPIVKLLRFF